MAEEAVDQLREQNVRAHSQIESLSKRNRSSEKDAKKALSVLRIGNGAEFHDCLVGKTG